MAQLLPGAMSQPSYTAVTMAAIIAMSQPRLVLNRGERMSPGLDHGR
jgi:hypothetical protein